MRTDSGEYFRRRLREIAGRKKEGEKGTEERPSAVSPLTLEEAFPESQVASVEGMEYLHLESPLDELGDAQDELEMLDGAFREERGVLKGYSPNRLLFLDLETCGPATSPLFLFGVMTLDGGPRLIQGLARRYPEEEALIRAVAGLIERYPYLVTFNGKAYDLPFVQQRAIRYLLKPPRPKEHLDLFHLARRRLPNGTLPNRKLLTLERFLLGKTRRGDVPSHLIPALYHQFIKSGDARLLVNVVRHNAYDVFTMAQLLPLLT